MGQQDKSAAPKHVILQLDEATAVDLEQLLYSLGELVAAGAPIHPPPADVEARLGVMYRDILRQLGKPTMAEAMQANMDAAHPRTFLPPAGGWPTLAAGDLVLPRWLRGVACSTVVPLRQQPGKPFFVLDDDVNASCEAEGVSSSDLGTLYMRWWRDTFGPPPVEGWIMMAHGDTEFGVNRSFPASTP